MLMKKTILIQLVVLSGLLTTVRGNCQRPDFSETCKKEMQKLACLVGDWKGEATVMTPAGTITVQQTEHIEWKMNNMLLSIEGIGREAGKDTDSFHAFALVNYDATLQQFKFKSYVKEGFSTDAYFKILEPFKFEWGFDIATGGKTRYIITIDPTKKTWHESGDYSRDGITWMKFIDMTLTKL